MSSDGRLLVVSNSTRSISVHQLETCEDSLACHASPVSPVALEHQGPDTPPICSMDSTGKYVLSGGSGRARLLSVVTRKTPQEREGAATYTLARQADLSHGAQNLVHLMPPLVDLFTDPGDLVWTTAVSAVINGLSDTKLSSLCIRSIYHLESW